MQITRHIFTAFAFISALSVSGQTLPIIQARVYAANEFKKEEQVLWEQALDCLEKIHSGKTVYEKLSDQNNSLVDSLEEGFGPMTEG